MLKGLRNSLKTDRRGLFKSFTAWLLFGAIILVFVFWGLTPQQAGVAEGGAAAIVNNSSISMLAFSEAVERMRRDPRFEQLQSLGGDMGRQILQQQVLSQLIELELIRQEVEKHHLLATDAEVRDVITEIPQFQEEGRFKRDYYMGYLRNVRKTPGEFENEVRNQQALRRTMRLFQAALRPIPMEVEKKKALEEIKTNLEVLSVPTETLVSSDQVKSSDLVQFMGQEGVEKRLKEYYESHQENYSTPERVKAQHILIKSQKGDVESEKKALERMKTIAERARTEDFAELAAEVSEDPGSKDKGGLLDFFERGKMVPEFESVAFSSPVGEISAPVKTQFGYHLIKVLEKQEAKNSPFEDVKEKIARTLLAQEKSKEALELLQKYLKDGEFSSVLRFAKENDLKWEETGAFTIEADRVPKIGGHDEAIQMAFQLTPEKPLAPRLVRQGATAFVLRHKGVPVAKTDSKVNKGPGEGSGDYIEEMLANRRSDDALRLWLENLRREAHISTNPQFAGSVRR